MKLSQRQLKYIIEAEVGNLRSPKGPNSREEVVKEDRNPMGGLVHDWSQQLLKQVQVIEDCLEDMHIQTPSAYDALAKLQNIATQMLRATGH